MTFKWTDELKQQVIADYQEREPTPENSMDIVQELADKIGATPNGVRIVLAKADVYVAVGAKKSEKKEAGEKKATGGTRVSKEAAHDALRSAIEKAGKPVNDEIISKLTGKAAQYFTELFN